MSTDSGGPRNKKEKRSNNGAGSRLMEGAASTDEELERHTLLAEAKSAIDAINLQSLQINTRCSFYDFTKYEEDIKTFKIQLTDFLNTNPLSLSKLVELSRYCKMFTLNVLAFVHTGVEEKTKLSTLLKTFMNHFKKLLEHLCIEKDAKVMEGKEFLKNDVSKITKLCCEIAEKIRNVKTSIKDSIVLYSSQQGRLLKKVSNCYADCVILSMKELEAISTLFKTIVKSFCERNIAMYIDTGTKLKEKIDSATVIILQCYYCHIWGISGEKDFIMKLEMAQFVDICCYLKETGDEYDDVVRMYSEAIKSSSMFNSFPSLLQEAKEIEKILAKKENACPAFEKFMIHLERDMYITGIRKERIPTFNEVYSNVIQVISRLICYCDQHWSSSADNLDQSIIDEFHKLHEDLFKCLSLDHKHMVISTFDFILTTMIKNVSNMQVKPHENLFDCKNQLQAIPLDLSKRLASSFDNITVFSQQMEKLQEELINCFQQLLSINHFINDTSFFQLLSDLKVCLVKSVQENSFDHLTKVTNEIIIKITSFESQQQSTMSMVDYRKMKITLQRPELKATHYFIYFRVIIKLSSWKLSARDKINLNMTYLLEKNTVDLTMEFHVVDCGRDYAIMSGGIAIARQLRKKLLYYKYFLYTSSEIPPAELLYRSSKQPTLNETENCYRVLVIPDTDCTIFDSCVHPQIRHSSFVTGFTNWLTSNVKLLPIIDKAYELSNCIEAHLSTIFRKLERCDLISNDEMHQVYGDLSMAYNSFSLAKIAFFSDDLNNVQTDRMYQENHVIIFENALMDVLNSLQSVHNTHKVLSGLVLLKIFIYMKRNVSLDIVKKLLIILQASYNPDSLECKEHAVIIEVLPDYQYRKNFIDGILTLIQILLKSEKDTFSWLLLLRVLPIYFWFVVDPPSYPFQSIIIEVEESLAWLKGLQLFDYAFIPQKQLRELKKDLQPFELAANAILQLFLLEICNYEYVLLLDYIPLSLMISYICIKLKNHSKIDDIVRHTSDLLDDVLHNKQQFDLCHIDFIRSLMNLLNTISNNFDAVYRNCVKSIIKTSLTLILDVLPDDDLKQMQFLSCLISKSVTKEIKSSVFSRITDEQSITAEYKLWIELHSIGNGKIHWLNILSQIIMDRYNKVTSFEHMLTIFEVIKQQSKDDNFVIVILFDILKIRIKETKELEKLIKTIERRKLLNYYIEVMFPSLPATFMDWEMWPVVLKCVFKNTDDFSEHTMSICNCVKKFCEDLKPLIVSGDVTVQQLNEISKKWDTRVLKILKALSLDNIVNELKNVISLSERKVSMFFIHMTLLQNVVSTCADKLNITLIPFDFHTLQTDYITMTVNSLCSYNDKGDLCFPVFPEAADVCDMLIPFAIMNSPQFQNDIYFYKWKECCKDIDNDSTLNDIFHNLWNPVFSHCSAVIDKLESQNIYLFEIVNLFGNIESAQIERTIQFLHTSVMKCRQDCTIESLVDARVTSIDGMMDHIKTSPESANWIKAVAKKVELCSSLNKLTHEAEISIETLSHFNLPKTAKLFDPFSKEGINHYLHRMLSSVSGVEQKLLLFLIASSNQEDTVKESIKKLGESKELVEFIRSKSNDVNEMDRFVKIALDTVAGEGAVVQNRLIDLTELCSRFSPVLYDITEDCESLVLEKFQSTWKSLKTCAISNLMETCLSSIKWYLSIGKLQGAGEKGTIKQLQDINQFGVYTVETTEQFHLCSVSLEIIEDEENMSKRNYSLNDLQELLSKLVLITRQTSTWVKDKEYFELMLRKICQISEAVQKLKEYGHMRFLDYEEQFPCGKNDSLKLDEKLDNLEFTLNGWIKYTWSCRYEFPHLNFYTTNQLMLLRKEFAFTQLQNIKDCDVSVGVFHLLHSIIGKPVDSTILIKKTLMEEDTKDSDEENVEVKDEIIESGNATSCSSIQMIKDKSDDKVEQGIKTLDPDQRALYDELVSCGYPEYLSLEAITTEQISDVYTAMEWCDELTDDDSTVIKNKWLDIEETVDSSVNTDLVKEIHSTLSPLTVDNSSSFSRIDSSHIASYFINLTSMKSNPFERSVSVDDGNLISLKKLGYCLQQMATRRNVTGEERTFSFEKGTPNLIVTSSDKIYFCILQLYSVEKNSTLPTYDEVLLCSNNTSLEQVTIFLMRALFNKQRGLIYCLAHAEKLSYLVAEKSMDLLKYLSQGIDDYQMIILCSSDGEEKSNIVSRLHSYRRQWTLADDEVLKEYLRTNLTCNVNKQQVLSASSVDENNSRVRLVTSQQSGVGKSLYIRKLKDKLVKKLKADGSFIDNKLTKALVTVPLHGPVVTADEILSMLFAEESDLKSCIIHLDIPQHVLKTVDDILFSLIILGGLSNSNGDVWRCHPSQLYALEVTMPRENTYLWGFAETRRIIKLLELLPVFKCLTPSLMLQSMNDNSEIIELKTPMYQRVYQYLKLYELKKFIELDNFVFVGTVEGTDKDCLDTIIKHMSIKQPTWKEIRHFVWFLNIQLSACEQSNFIRRVKGLLCFTVGFMINMSQDFATSSISTPGKTNILEEHKLQNFWEEKSHSYLFFNKNRTSITHVGLKLEQTFLKDIYTDEIIMKDIQPDMLLFLTDIMKIPTNYQKMVYIEELFERLVDFMNIKIPEGSSIESPDTNYVLTNDNLTKIMAIQARFRCQIPVVLMGETGCGKTHLIRFMCKFAAYNKNVRNMFILKVHGGTTEQDVIDCLEEAEETALENRKHKVDTVVFFDEANTSDVISLIKEIMCDGRCKGKPVPPYIKFIAACNPYRRHSEEMIEKLKKAGLGWRDEVATEKIGEIPLRDLVYRVLELPDSMKALVYDFGQLNSATEREYIEQMVHSRLRKFKTISEVQKLFIANLLANCQDKMKKMKDECSFVSLRDVERALIIFEYFFRTFTRIFKITEFDHIDDVTKCILLTLGVSHLPRMAGTGRVDFMNFIAEINKNNNPLKASRKIKFNLILTKFQDALLDCMEIENNIAKNTALKENVFMMFVCIELRIPLFVVGKPGSSKSLAKTIIENSMKGPNSKNEKMKNFKQIHLHSHQCSNLSTPASITEAFDNAKNYQEKKNSQSFVSVVVLDEVGLAEASPHLPLKALHPLLEDGTVGSGSDDQRVSREDRVAFVGISNWALDPAKMNRGIMVTRSKPTIDDLKESAMGICNQRGENDPVLPRLKTYFSRLAMAYLEIFKTQEREFFGLRDFYSLIKMLYWMSAKSGSILTRPQIEHAIRRNFSGFDEFNPIEKFNLEELKISSCLGSLPFLRNFRDKDVVLIQCKENDRYISINDNEEIELVIEEIINAQFIIHINNGRVTFRSLSKNNLWLGTDRHANDITLIVAKSAVQFVVKEATNETCHIHLCKQQYPPVNINGNDEFILLSPDDPETNPDCSPLGLISKSLSNKEITYHGESRYLLFLTDNYSSIQVLEHFIVLNCQQESTDDQISEPYVLFGSNFPKDSEFAQVCRNISEIRLCMESGRMVILLNLENLYESLYDVLNQYYVKSGGHRYVDLGLRTNRMKCAVHEQFKLILIAEKDKVYKDFPTPLINRLEKHFVNAKTVLTDWQVKVYDELDKWLKLFEKEKFTLNDAFIGMSSDTIAAVILQSTNLVESSIDDLERNEKVRELSKRLLLQMASPDAILRWTDGHEYRRVYFIEQEHSSLAELIKRIDTSSWDTTLLQVTTHSPTLTQDELLELGDYIELDSDGISRIHLESFQTEQDFLNSVDLALEKGKYSPHCVIYECESGHKNGNLISCCRYRLVDKCIPSVPTFFVLLIHLPKKCPNSNFAAFQEKPWLCYHVDALLPSVDSFSLAILASTNTSSISDFFYHDELKSSSTQTSVQSFDFPERIEHYTLLPPAVSKLNAVNLCKRMHLYVSNVLSSLPELNLETDRLQKLIDLTPKRPDFPLSEQPPTFYSGTVFLIKNILKEMEVYSQQPLWIYDEAGNMDTLQEAGTFQNALIRKFDKLVIPIFTKILSFVDNCKNLNILLFSNSDEISKLWIELYTSGHVTNELLSHVLNEYSAVMQNSFQCRFPFVWIIFDLAVGDQNPKSLLDTLIGSEIFGCFANMSSCTLKILSECYIHDKICFIQKKLRTQSNAYYEVLINCISSMVAPKVPDIEDDLSLFKAIVAVETVVNENKCFIDLLSELMSQMPSVAEKLNSQTNQDLKVLMIEALAEVLNSPYFDVKVPLNNGPVAVSGWMQKLYELHEIISKIVQQIIDIIPQDLLLKWQWICVMKMFFEHVVLLNEESMIMFAKRIEKYSEKSEKFQTPSTLKTVALLLNAVVNKKLPRKEQNITVVNCCWSFFIEVLSSICINDSTAFDEDIFRNIISCVYPDKDQKPMDEKLWKFLQQYPSNMKFLQSIVIKFLLQHEHSLIELLVEDIHHRVAKFGSSHELQMTDFCNIIISNITLQITEPKGLLSLTDDFLIDVCDSVDEHTSESNRLLAVAKLRLFVDALAVNLIKSSNASFDDDKEREYMFSEAKKYIDSSTLNEDQFASGPKWYLLRCIVRKLGIDELMTLTSNDNNQWILPTQHHMDKTYFDFVAIYNPKYQSIRSAVSSLAATGDVKELENELKTLQVTDMVMFVMAILERVHSSYLMPEIPSKAITSKVIDKFCDVVMKCKLINQNQEAIKAFEEIIHNKQCRNFPLMKVAKKESIKTTMIRMVVIHSVMTVLLNKKTPNIRFLASLLLSPECLKESLLPAIGSLNPATVTSEAAESFYACIKGHQYTFDMLESHCPHCGNIVSDHKAKDIRKIKHTDFGYAPAVGDGFCFGNQSSFSYAIIRCIIHSCLLWSTCSGKNIKLILKGNINDIPLYFWNEIEKDIIQLSEAIGRSIDEACLILHLVLKEIAQQDLIVKSGTSIKLDRLETLDHRKQWEEQFHQAYIEPVMKDFDASIQQALKRLKFKDYNDIFGTVYINPLSSEKFLWHLHPVLSREQFELMHVNCQLADVNPVLYAYLTELCSLQACYYIPDILKLQIMTQDIILKCGYDKEASVQCLTVSDFIKDQEQKLAYEALYESLQKAWDLCRHNLADYDRLHDFKLEYLQQTFDKDTLMKFLIPMTSGPGVITTALIDYLIITHNKFITLCRSYVEKSLKRKWLWKAPLVHLLKAEPAHFLSVEDDFDGLLAYHGVHTSSNGVTKIQFNFEGIEKDIIQKFVLGKPLITHCMEIPQVIWHKPIYDTKAIAAIKRNVKQVPLQHQAKSDILREVKDISAITTLTDVIEVVMKVLQKQAGEPKRKLKAFIETDLMLNKKLRSETVANYCCLEHVVSLWKFFNVEKAKIKVRNKENPFTSTKDEFNQELDDKLRLELEKSISKMSNLDHLLEIMYELIMTYVQFCSLDTRNQPLRVVLKDFVSQAKSEPIVNLMDIFPADITLSQVVSSWKEIVLQQDNIRKTVH